MELIRLTDRIWYYPFEKERDRPNLGYIRGDHWSLAVDAGHSAEHTAEFYRAIREAGLPLPGLTVLTHWHWDHTFGMHAVNGLTLANAATNRHLLDFQTFLAAEGNEAFFAMDECIRKEYADGQPVIVRPADLVFSGEMTLDPGGCPVRLLRTVSPHTDDSTLIHVVNEKVLFVGDAAGGVFPTWEKDPALCRCLADTLETIDASVMLRSHQPPDSKAGLIRLLLDEGL